MGGDNEKGWQVAEEETYQYSVAQNGGYEYLDPIIAPVDYALHRNPTGFSKIPGYESLYLAKTKLRIIRDTVIPSFRVWFRVDEKQRKVWKLWVEMAPPEDMGFATDPWDPDEIPF